MERWRNEEGGGSSDWPTFPAAQGEQSRLGPQPCSTRLPPPSESCSQTIFVPAVKGSYLFWTQLVRGESTQSPFLPRVPLQLYNPPSVRHPGIKLSRKPQKVQETQHRKTEKGTGQAFLPSLGRQRSTGEGFLGLSLKLLTSSHSSHCYLVNSVCQALGTQWGFAERQPLSSWNLLSSWGERQKSLNKNIV